MIHHWAIDTSILVRIATGHPKTSSEALLRKLETYHQTGSTLWVSSMVLGEAYIAIQHHYGVPKKQIRLVLLDLLEKGWLKPMDGVSVLESLRAHSGAGLMDRLIALQAASKKMKTLTLDQKMAKLASCELF